MTDNTALPPSITNETASKPASEQPKTAQNLPLNLHASQPPSTVSLDDALSVKNSATAIHSVNGKAEEPAKSGDGKESQLDLFCFRTNTMELGFFVFTYLDGV